MNLLLTSIGKRIQLIEHLKNTFRVVGADASGRNAARYFTDGFYQAPRCDEAGYVSALLAICEREQIDMLIPLYEGEFPVLNKARGQFEELGVHLALSGEQVIDVCNDKRRTAAFFEKYDIPAPRVYSRDQAEAAGRYPLIVKPFDGMGSRGVFQAENREQLDFFCRYVDKPLIQDCAVGTEYTIDVLCDEGGTPVYIVPRIRLEVRSGEVVKSRTAKRGILVRETKRLLEALNREGSVAGPLTVQCFLSGGSDEEKISFIEINPRFGGGVPLSFAAGADYGKALGEMCGGKRWGVRTEEEYLGDFSELTMLRYEQAVYETADGQEIDWYA
ncbi:MAG: ATP-grasp domain-containing protein [Firmicutes bacterium]|nr:ATP-grasp domain-containing protein [Bacillota bacterium]